MSRRAVTTAAMWSVPAVSVATAAPAFAASLESSTDLYLELRSPDMVAFSAPPEFYSEDYVDLALVVGNRGGLPVAEGTVLTIEYRYEGSGEWPGVWPAPGSDGSDYACEDFDHENPGWGQNITPGHVTVDATGVTMSWILPAIGADASHEILAYAQIAVTDFPFMGDDDEEEFFSYTVTASVIPLDDTSEFKRDDHVVAGPAFQVSRRRRSGGIG